jgi:membrane associated rhomboid family serine protease
MKENMMFGPSTMDLIANGAQITPCITEDGQWWRLFVSQFLHGGVLHWGFNMYGLYALAAPMEQDFGSIRVLVIYLAAGLSSALSTALLLPQAVCIGASGAICGLVGAEWAELLMNLSLYRSHKCQRFCQICLPTVFLFLLSLLPGVNFFAHFSGMVCGLFIGMTLVIRSRYGQLPTQAFYKKGKYTYQVLLAALGLIAAIMLLLVQLVLVYKVVDINQYCSWCKYLVCIPSRISDCKSTNLLPCGSTVEYDPSTPFKQVLEITCMGNSSLLIDISQGPRVSYNDLSALSQVCKSHCKYHCPFQLVQ